MGGGACSHGNEPRAALRGSVDVHARFLPAAADEDVGVGEVSAFMSLDEASWWDLVVSLAGGARLGGCRGPRTLLRRLGKAP